MLRLHCCPRRRKIDRALAATPVDTILGQPSLRAASWLSTRQPLPDRNMYMQSWTIRQHDDDGAGGAGALPCCAQTASNQDLIGRVVSLAPASEVRNGGLFPRLWCAVCTTLTKHCMIDGSRSSKNYACTKPTRAHRATHTLRQWIVEPPVLTYTCLTMGGKRTILCKMNLTGL